MRKEFYIILLSFKLFTVLCIDLYNNETTMVMKCDYFSRLYTQDILNGIILSYSITLSPLMVHIFTFTMLAATITYMSVMLVMHP